MINRRSSVFLHAGLLVLSTAVAAQSPTVPGRIYECDTSHSLLSFTARHVGFARVRGTFKEYRAAAYIVEDDLTRSSVSAVIQAGSIDTNLAGRDGVLRDEFFRAKEFPEIRFQSTRIEKIGTAYAMTGQLTIRDVTREVRLPFAIVSRGEDQFQNQRIALETSLFINRKDYGVIYDNQFWDGVVSDEVTIEIEVSLRKYNALNTVFPWRNSVGKVLLDAAQNQVPDAVRALALRLWNVEREKHNFGLSAFYRAGVALTQQRRFDAAVAVFQAGLEINASAEPSDRADILAALAETLVQAGSRQPAIEHLEKALALDPANPSARELLGHLRPN
jgi:polyisoprenoid-binding protein YceI